MARLPRLAAALLVTALVAPEALAATPYTPWIGAKLRGNEVVAVIATSPAEVAGLEVRDRILSVDGAQTPRGADVARAIQAGEIGQFSVVRVQRGAKELSLAVFVAARPDRD
ncbi:MAG: PDZ domain-containing protein, partial [Deltaproteobacteria bacterium]